MAANVLQSIDFHPRTVTHAPSPFGFGFGLGPTSSHMAAPSWQSPAPSHSSACQQAIYSSSSSGQSPASRAQKRRHEPEEESENIKYPTGRDESMDRSPTPERPRRIVPKRARLLAVPDGGLKDEKAVKQNKSSGSSDENDVDVGVLLASLPSQSLLPLLTALLTAQPSLKSTILPLIPRPTLDTAIQALALSAKKLRDAYPYSTTSPSIPHSGVSPASFGFGYGSASAFGSLAGLGRNSNAHVQSVFGSPSLPNSQSGSGVNGGMRDSYILSRLRPHITEFVAACISYLPYFSYIQTPATMASQAASTSTPQPQPHSMTLQALHKDKAHPSETYLFLSALTQHFFSQPPLTQSSMSPLLLPRLSDEWKAWVDRVDEVVNQQGGMFGSETVRSWERELDEFANKESEGGEVMRSVRDRWVSKVGWLVGRRAQHPMEEV